MSDARAAGTSAVAGARRPVQIGLYLTNQHPVGADMVEALRGARSVVPPCSRPRLCRERTAPDRDRVGGGAGETLRY